MKFRFLNHRVDSTLNKVAVFKIDPIPIRDIE